MIYNDILYSNRVQFFSIVKSIAIVKSLSNTSNIKSFIIYSYCKIICNDYRMSLQMILQSVEMHSSAENIPVKVKAYVNHCSLV